MSYKRRISLYWGSLKPSGMIKLVGALTALVGGGYKVLSEVNREAIDLVAVYKNDQESTIIILSSISLIGLGLLAEKGAFKDRLQNRSMRDILPDVEDKIPVKQAIKSATQEIWLTGIAFASTIDSNRQEIEQLLDSKKIKIKILIAPKSGPVFEQITVFFPTYLPAYDLTNRLNLSHTTLLKWSKKYTNLEVKTYKVLPTHTLIIIDPKDNYEMQIQHFLHDTDTKASPVILLKNNEHRQLFAFYKKEFQTLWEGSEDLK